MRINPILVIVVIVASAAGGYAYWLKDQSERVPEGLARANGRIEVERVDVATKYTGRLAEVRVDEGADVEKDSILARLDTTEILTQLAAAKAAVHRAHQLTGRAQASVDLQAAELKLAQVELKRVVELQLKNTASVAELDRRTAQRDVAKASLDGAKVDVEDAKAATEVAEAQVAQIEAVIADMTLKAPVTGRVEYRLAQNGEVVAAGGRVLTLLDLSDVHMTIFLPTSQVGRVELGSEARIVLDSAPEYVVPATGLAIEDAAVISALLGRHSLDAAFRAYDARRVARARRIAAASRFYAAIAQWQHPVMVRVRNRAVTAIPESVLERQLSSILDYRLEPVAAAA
jgi:HlyD family secretion protein